MTKPLTIAAEALPTDVFHLHDDLLPFLDKHLERFLKDGGSLEENILAVTSKIVSLAEGAVVPKSEIRSKRELVKREAERYLGEGGYGVELTIKHGILIPSAGVDESNAEGDYYILFPRDPYATARRIGEHLRARFAAKNFGVVLTDSHTTPLRQGVSGIGLAHWGFKATTSKVNEADIFGRKLKFTHVNVLDTVAAAAVYVMGEAAEKCPLALVRAGGVEFTSVTSSDEIKIDPDLDLYGPLLK